MPESIEDIIRRVVAEELQRALPAIIEGVASRAEPAPPPPPQPAVLSPSDWLTSTEVAEIAGFAQSTVAIQLRRGVLHGTKPVGARDWQIRRGCLNAWLEGVECEHRKREPLNLRRR